MTEDAKTDVNPAIKYANFNTRIIATAIDLFVIMTVAVPVIDIVTGLLFHPLDMAAFSSITDHPEVMFVPAKAIPIMLDIIKQQQLVGRALLNNTLQCTFIALYTLPCWFRYSATPGKMLMRLQIQDMATGTPMPRKQALLRFLGYIVSFLPFSLGFLWIMFNKKHRGFHDMLAGTVVIVKPKQQNINN